MQVCAFDVFFICLPNAETSSHGNITSSRSFILIIVVSKSKSTWFPEVEATLLEAYSGTMSLDDAFAQCQQQVDECLASE